MLLGQPPEVDVAVLTTPKSGLNNSPTSDQNLSLRTLMAEVRWKIDYGGT